MKCSTTILTRKKFMIELASRAFLLFFFIYLEHQKPFNRIIHKEELWLYQNPTTKSYISGTKLWLFIALPSPFLPIFYHLISSKWQKYENRISDIISGTLAITLLLPLNGIVTNVIKLCVGRPRPDFAFRCWPQTHGMPEAILEGEIFQFENGLPQDLHCHGDPDAIIEGRKSFPSGHSSFSFAVYVFSFLYLSGKLRVFAKQQAYLDEYWSVKFLFVLFFLLVPLTFAISRTCDYHHHWQDVTIGSIIGSLLAVLIYLRYYPFINHQHSHLNLSSFSTIQTYQKDDSNLPLTDIEASF